MQMTRWILAFLLLSAVSVFADTIPGDPQMDPLPCSGSIPLTLGAGGSLVTANGPNLFASTLSTPTTPGTSFCYANQTGAPIGGISITANRPTGDFTCPHDSTLFTLCSISFVGNTVTFTFLQGNGTGVPGCTFSVDRAQVCGEFEFTAPGFPLGAAFTASVSSVPEPSTLAMMLPGLAFAGNKIRRRLRRHS